MRMLDAKNKNSIRNLQLYLTSKEAREMRDQLDRLLKDPEAIDHFHLHCENSDRELSCSLITKRKLSDLSGYTEEERKILSEK